jgi:hypothetical protein
LKLRCIRRDCRRGKLMLWSTAPSSSESVCCSEHAMPDSPAGSGQETSLLPRLRDDAAVARAQAQGYDAERYADGRKMHGDGGAVIRRNSSG